MAATDSPMDMKVLEKVHAKRKPKARQAPRADAGPTKSPVYREPPKAQARGPIVAGPTDWVVCSTCSRLFSTKESPVRYGVRKRHAARHLSDHRMGRIKRPKETPQTEHRDYRRRQKKLMRSKTKMLARLDRVFA